MVYKPNMDLRPVFILPLLYFIRFVPHTFPDWPLKGQKRDYVHPDFQDLRPHYHASCALEKPLLVISQTRFPTRSINFGLCEIRRGRFLLSAL